MNSARAMHDAPTEVSEEHRLSDAIDICSELAASKSIQHLCEKAVCLIAERLSSSNAAILLDSSAPDSKDPFWGIGKNGEPILNESDSKEYNPEGPHLLSPLITHDGIHLGKLITGASEIQGAGRAMPPSAVLPCPGNGQRSSRARLRPPLPTRAWWCHRSHALRKGRELHSG